MGLGSQRQLDPDRILFALDPVILGESGAQFARLGPDDRTVPGVEAGVPAEHRGYGLVDSPKVRLAPGQNRALTAVLVPSARAAAQYYPASYWYSLIQIPPESDFPGTGPQGTESVPRWRPSTTGSIRSKKLHVCHQLGNPATRESPKALGTFASSIDAWDRRLQVGQDGQGMSNFVTQMGRMRGLQMFADWTDRTAAGEVPPAPPRPSQRERNLVITMWE